MSRSALAASVAVSLLFVGCGSSSGGADAGFALDTGEDASEDVGAPGPDASGGADDGGIGCDGADAAPAEDASTLVDGGSGLPPPASQALARRESEPFNLIIDATRLYWINAYYSDGPSWATRIRTVLKRGGAVTTLGNIGGYDRPSLGADLDGNVYYDLVIRDEQGCWSEGPCAPIDWVMWLPAGSGVATRLGYGGGPIGVDETSVYVRGFSGENTASPFGLLRIPKDGFGSTLLLAPVNGGRGDVVPWGSSVYWATPESGTIERVPKTGGPPSVLLSSATLQPEHLKVDYEYVYFSDPARGLFAIPRGGGTPIVLRQRAGITSLDAYAGVVYWTEFGCLGRISNRGEDAACLETSDQRYDSVRVDGEAVYFIRGNDILRLDVNGDDVP